MLERAAVSDWVSKSIEMVALRVLLALERMGKGLVVNLDVFKETEWVSIPLVLVGLMVFP